LSLEFKEIYVSHYSKLKRFAKEYVVADEDAENIVQDVFTHLLENWTLLSTYQNIFSYLFLITKNKCTDFLRHKMVVQKAADEIAEEYYLSLKASFDSLDSFNQHSFSQEDIEEIVQKALNTLPERCREIFIKNKIEGKKQKEIAEELNISVNTIESQMAIAYKKLRIELKDLFPLFLFLFC
jgi:RNA polymerase sigma-70 factor (ECF subfamily)